MITAEPPKVVAGALYNATQACKILGGISRATLWKYVKSGFIHPKGDMITGRKLYEGRELTRFWYSRV